MKKCPKCQSTNVLDKAKICPYCLYSFEEIGKSRETSSGSNPNVQPVKAPERGATSAKEPTPGSGLMPQQVTPRQQENSPQKAPAKKNKMGKAKWLVLIITTIFIVVIILSCGAIKNANTNSQALGSEGYTENEYKEMLDEADAKYDKAVAEYEAENYLDGSIPQCEEALQSYIVISENTKMRKKLKQKIRDAYALYQDSLLEVSRGILAQGAIPGGYEQTDGYLHDAIEMANTLQQTGDGYEVDNTAVINFHSSLVDTYRDLYIEAINNITTYDQWSRGEAWNYAEQAYEIQDEAGVPILFSLDNQDDPLWLRYKYCYAMIARKQCETGIVEGSMSYADAIQILSGLLEETDYNPLVLQDMIRYGNVIGINVSNYQRAYDEVLSIIENEEGITIGEDVALDRFWYFNDLDGEEKYKVGEYGTTSYVRKLIRENIPSVL